MRCVGERILGQRLQCETLRFRLGSLTRRSLPPRGNRLADGKATQIKSLLGLVLIILSERASERASNRRPAAAGFPAGRLDVGTRRVFSKSKLEAARGHGCDGLVETIETLVSVIPCKRRKSTERRRKACWDLENFHQVPEPVGRKKTPDPVGRITCYSTID